MMNRTHKLFLVTASIFLLLVSTAWADGFIIVDYPPDFPPQRRFARELTPPSIKFHKVSVDINEQVTKTSVDQVFINEENQDLEGTYIFPVPEGATVSDFAMFIDGKRQAAELMDKDKARNIYEDIVRRKQDPALLEYIGSNLFKARVYPVPARGEKQIQLEYQQVLPQDSKIVKYVYPLNTEKFSSKPIQTVSVAVSIKSKSGIKNVYSPSHKIDVQKKTDNEVKVSFEESNSKPDKDFTLYYTVSDEDLGISMISHKPAKEDGYFMLLASPKVETEKKVIPKDICFVVDTSGSMSGDKHKQVQSALKFCVNNLESDDTFNIISFSTEPKLYEKNLVVAKKDNVEEALKYIDGMRAIGGTNINEALYKALKMEFRKDVPAFIVFLTDGMPTVDVTDPTEILKNVKKENGVKAKIFCFGVGTDLNTTLLDKLAVENNGVIEYVTENEDIELKISNFYTKIASPVLTDVAVDFGSIKTDNAYPKEIPDFFKGSQLVLIGRYREGGASAVTIKGKVLGAEKKYANDVKFSEKTDDNNFLPRIWAQRRIGYLLEEIRLHGENKELKEEIVELAKKHGIMTPYTSFLVLEDNAQIGDGQPGNIMIERRQRFFEDKVMSKAGAPASSMSSSERDTLDNAQVFMAPSSEKSMKSESGSGAVHMSRVVKKIQSSDRAFDFSKIDPDSMRYVEDKTFVKRGGEWRVSTFDEKRDSKNIVSVKFGSKLYFALISKHKNAGKYCALGRSVLFEIDGKFVRIGDSGEEDEGKLDSFLK
ncbi:MAG: hypothetical protein A2008_09190 [Candidatus Wallbacteria bacterium GWC2_49_35]|uniref:Trypsin n=1 Tax=Candidatus Wallbacteria bacterium GWC2_49_35 TaxID=1817813 RepID=A0A1F7X154_9BACT|nr:MAG: hypothetical protein A2008_09190 [Candidatus Wallbacteria bacterium GWC2_49_35]